MLPEHSMMALLLIILQASFISSISMLSNIIISAFTSKASLTWSKFSTSTSIFFTKGLSLLTFSTASLIPPAASMWLSLSIIPSDKLYLWLYPPPRVTAYFSKTLMLGVVFLVSRIFTWSLSRASSIFLV